MGVVYANLNQYVRLGFHHLSVFNFLPFILLCHHDM